MKRAYQKALLCLHPDKLQQKGAAWHQRYVAEIVFKILQVNCNSVVNICSEYIFLLSRAGLYERLGEPPS